MCGCEGHLNKEGDMSGRADVLKEYKNFHKQIYIRSLGLELEK